MKPLISIIVPTKNRYKYLKHLIELVESFNNPKIELLVQDNSDNNEEILTFIKGKKFTSLHYIYNNAQMTMSENADQAFLNSNGEYLCFIGDDDGVCRNIVECCEWMKKNDIQAVRSIEIQFIWNDAHSDNNGQGFVYYETISNSYKFLNPKKEFDKVLKNGIPGMQKMPKFYHGIVRRDILDNVYSIGGTCFPGGSPDIAVAVSMIPFISKYAFVNFPVVLPGISKMVGGGVKGKVLKLEEVSFINQSVIDNWENDIPRIWATELVWPESAKKAMKYSGQSNKLKLFNQEKMLARFIIFNKEYFNEAYKYSKNKIKFIFWLTERFLYLGTKHTWQSKIIQKLNGKINGKFTVTRGLTSIKDAEEFLHRNNFYHDFNSIVEQ